MAIAPNRSILSLKSGALFLSLLLLNSIFSRQAAGFGDARREYMKEKVRKMFYHAYENYMAYAFPHDELKPLTGTFTDSLSELGNLKLEHLPQNYQGSALTLIESLSRYHEADMRTGRATYWQLTSLQAFWPGLQVLVGDVAAANSSHREFYSIWERFGVLPERYLLDRGTVHPTEKYYPLRPELAESTFYLYQATKDPWYMEVGESIIRSLNRYTKVKGGFASIRDVTTMQQEDHQHSFFLSETCKYLYLLYDDAFLAGQNYVFTTEGHPLPIRSSWHEKLPESYIPYNWTRLKSEDGVLLSNSMSQRVCPVTSPAKTIHRVESACHIPDNLPGYRCRTNDECGIDSTTCRKRTCSLAGYCGLWVFVD